MASDEGPGIVEAGAVLVVKGRSHQGGFGSCAGGQLRAAGRAKGASCAAAEDSPAEVLGPARCCANDLVYAAEGEAEIELAVVEPAGRAASSLRAAVLLFLSSALRCRVLTSRGLGFPLQPWVLQ